MGSVMTIGIAGGTGSGKTTITRRLLQKFSSNVSVIYHDNYYTAHNDLTYEQRSLLNYDCPDAFDTELSGTTKFIIAQRISSVKDADQIVILSDGQIADVGTHDELLGRSEEYQEIYYSQFEKEEGKMAAAEEGVSVHE